MSIKDPKTSLFITNYAWEVENSMWMGEGCFFIKEKKESQIVNQIELSLNVRESICLLN